MHLQVPRPWRCRVALGRERGPARTLAGTDCRRESGAGRCRSVYLCRKRQPDIRGQSRGCFNFLLVLDYKCKLTFLTGADVQYPGHGAVLGDLRIPAVTAVVWVDVGGGQGVWLQGVAVHLDPFQIQALLITGWHRPEGKKNTEVSLKKKISQQLPYVSPVISGSLALERSDL